jgi:DNA-binding PadR family transcriptional regulator
VTAPAPTGREGIRDRERCDTLVLAALHSADRDGYGVLQRLQEGAGRTKRPSPRQVFAALHRLHRNRLVARSARNPRNYRLTETGSRVLAARTTAADTFAGALHALQDSGDAARVTR